MVSQRGTLNLFHTEAQRDLFTRRANQMRLLGVDAEAVSRAQVQELVPLVDLDNGRYPVLGGFLQRRGGTVRHDAVAWGYARAASARGVDIIEHCEVTGITPRAAGGSPGSRPRAASSAPIRVCLAVAGHSSQPGARWPGCALPIETPRAAGLRQRGDQAGARRGADLRRRAFLRQPVRQGRPGVRRRPSTATTPTGSAARCRWPRRSRPPR